MVAHHGALADAEKAEAGHDDPGFLQTGLSPAAQHSLADPDSPDRLRHFPGERNPTTNVSCLTCPEPTFRTLRIE